MKGARVVFLSLLVVTGSLLLNSCNVLRKIPEGKHLLDKNTIKTDHPEFKEYITTIIKQKPNRKILGVFRFHLGVYFLADHGKRPTKFKKWLKTAVGEEPIFLDTALTHKSTEQIAIYMQNNGYFDSRVSDSVKYRKNTAKVTYTIDAGEPYRYRTTHYQIADDVIDREVMKDTAKTLLVPGEIYSSSSIQKERDRISTALRNKGYYFFNPQYISFVIDSAGKQHHVDVYTKIANPPVVTTDSVSTTRSTQPHRKAYFKEILIDMEYDPIILDSNLYRDTIYFEGYKVLVKDSLHYLFKPHRLINEIQIRPDSLFSQAAVDQTYQRLGDLGVFRFVSVKFDLLGAADSTGNVPMRAQVLLAPSKRQEYKLEAEGTNSGGNLGVAGNIYYRNKNIFRGAESFEFKVKGGLELQRKFSDTTYASLSGLPLFNAYELGPSVTLNFPRLLGFESRNPKISNRSTSFTAGYNIQNRPEYYRQLANLSFYYTARYGIHSRLFWYPAEINYLKVNLDPVFQQKLNDKGDINLILSYTDQLISNGRLSYVYSNQNLEQAINYWYFRMNLEYAGNTLYLGKTLSGEKIDAAEGSKFMNVRFAQYVRPDFDFRFYNNFNKSSSLVFRLLSGIGLAYGNSGYLPFEKSYFAGGSNDIRAWRSRSLGPGATSSSDFLEQLGEIKLGSNVEYRFDILRKLKGAFFVDAGNIWLLHPVDGQSGGLFKFDSFAKEIAVGSGLGLRFDFTFFILRLDGGVQLKDPAEPVDKRWVFRVKNIKDVAFNFGIGYPF